MNALEYNHHTRLDAALIAANSAAKELEFSCHAKDVEIARLQQALDDQSKRPDLLREAVEFYADPANWQAGRWPDGEDEVANLICVAREINDDREVAVADQGDRARAALEALKQARAVTPFRYERGMAPCPFCGSDSIELHPYDLARAGPELPVENCDVYYAHCNGCGAEGPQSFKSEEAIEGWNAHAAVAEGQTRVPIIPTEEMEVAGGDALLVCRRDHPGMLRRSTARVIYQRMIAKAPKT